MLGIVEECALFSIESLHVTSYQAKFASHHTRHVGFLLAWHGYRKTQQNVPFLFIQFVVQYEIITT